MKRALLIITPSIVVYSFVTTNYHNNQRLNCQTKIQLSPLNIDEMFEKDNVFEYNRDQYDFALVEENDLIRAAELSMISFYTPRVKVDTTDMNGMEKYIWGGIIGTLNKLDKMDARNSHYVGFKSRANNRLRNPSLHISLDSVLLALHDKLENRIIGLIEICLEPADGKLAPAVAMHAPWKSVKDTDQPYLCNLCVCTTRRRQGLGKQLCLIAERIVMKYWKRDTMYLHVDESNVAAQKLYENMGYVLGPQLPSWERRLNGLESILYYKKDLRIRDISANVKGHGNVQGDSCTDMDLGLSASDFENVSKNMNNR